MLMNLYQFDYVISWQSKLTKSHPNSSSASSLMTGLGMGSVPSGTLSLVAADVASDAAACASVAEHDACAVDVVVVSISSSVCITKLGLADFSAQNADLCTAFCGRQNQSYSRVPTLVYKLTKKNGETS